MEDGVSDDGEVPKFQDLLLKSARNGDYKTVSEIIKANEDGKVSININCKGESKYNLGWTPLHLSAYFGHKESVEILLCKGAMVDVQNDSGDTPLHKAALTNREEIVMLLLEHGASVSIINGEGLKASEMGRKSQARKLILGAEKAEKKIKEGKLIQSSREGDAETVKKMLQDAFGPNINCTDSMGNTALHCAAYRGHIGVAVVLLQNGCDTNIKNASGQTALDLVRCPQMEQVLAVPAVRSLSRSASRFEGPLLRRMRIVGWRLVWAVLERGVLTFFKSRADASSGVGRRDYKYLDGAKALAAAGGDQAAFVVQYSDGARHRLSALPDPVHSAGVNRQKWVSAMEEHIRFSTHYVQHGFSIDDDDEEDRVVKPLGCMEDALGTAKAHQEVIEQNVQEVMALISYMEEEDLKQGPVHNILRKFTSLSSTGRSMSNSLSHCLSLFKQQEEARALQLKEEKEKVRVLEEALRVLATEHHDLEESVASRLSASDSSPSCLSLYNTPNNSFRSNPRPNRFFPASADDEFYDAFSQDDDTCTLKSLPSPCSSECSTNTLVSCMSSLPLDPQSSDPRHLSIASPPDQPPQHPWEDDALETNGVIGLPRTESAGTISSGTGGCPSLPGSSSFTISLSGEGPPGSLLPLTPETPLVRTSGLSDGEVSGSDSSQEKIGLLNDRDETSSFSLIYLGGTRYEGAHGGSRRLWRNWGRFLIPLQDPEAV